MDRPPGASPVVVTPWVGELLRTLPGLLPGPLSTGTRQRLLVAVSEANGSRWCAWVHGAWRDFLGGADAVEAEERLLAFARDCAAAARPLDPAPLLDVLPPEAVRAVRATVASVELGNLVANSADRVLARHPGVWDVAATALALPFAVPSLAVAGALRAVDRLAPAPQLEVPDDEEANLLVHVVAASLRAWLGNAAVRLGLLRLPFTVTIALRDGRSAATVRVGQGRVAVRNGIDERALVLLEGELGPLLRAASGSFLEQLGHVRIRRA